MLTGLTFAGAIAAADTPPPAAATPAAPAPAAATPAAPAPAATPAAPAPAAPAPTATTPAAPPVAGAAPAVPATTAAPATPATPGTEATTPGIIKTQRPPLDPLWQAEVRMGYGLQIGGSGARMSTRISPLTLAAIASFAIQDEPPLYAYGGLLVETLDRNAAGATAGITFKPHDSRLRLSGGGAWIVAPYSLIGATASGGICRPQAPRLGLCGEVQLTAFFAGSDLADGHAVTQIQLVLGAVFDAM